jgi:hypothetical protein
MRGIGAGRGVLLVTICVLLSLLVPAPAAADRIRSYGVMVGGGASERIEAVVVPVQLELGLRLPELIDQPLRDASIRVEWTFKLWASAILGQENTAEGGLNPIGLRVAWDWGQRWVPFGEVGLGVMGTGLRNVKTGGPFQFDQTAGGGVQWFLDPRTAISLSYQYRHMSNSRIYDQNSGLDTHFALLGLHWFPRRFAK